MKIHRLRVESFAGIAEADLAFGPGLNILYGPNDLGKSTLADAIRLALLIPHSSSYCDPYVPWAGAQDPLVELTFETEAQRIWRVRKQFGKGGHSLLQESRNGQDFDDVVSARQVDARLRDLLGWGLREPGGAGSGRSFPTSFLSTALLSTQADVTAVLDGSLEDDPTATGKERIAKALEAAAQDPLFVALLRETQARKDEAFTDKGTRKTARGSVFQIARDRLREARDEKERFQRLVDDSEGVERSLDDLFARRDRLEHEREAAADRLEILERLERQAADRDAAAGQVGMARDAVLRIRRMDQGVADAEAKVGDLAARREQARQALADAQIAETAAGEALDGAVQSAGLESGMADTVARQALELRKAAAEQVVREAQQAVDAAAQAKRLVDAAAKAEAEHRQQETEAARARERRSEAAKKEQAANEELSGCDLLQHALETRSAERQAASARAEVEKEAALQAHGTRLSEERNAMAERRAAITVPPPVTLAALRKLETELASARGALNVGLVMTVTPTVPLSLEIKKDGAGAGQGLFTEPFEIEADAEVQVRITNLATVRVRGGKREAQETVHALESRWVAEALPHLTAAGAEDLDALDAKLSEARELDSRLKALDGELESVQRQLSALAGAAEALNQASARRLALGDVPMETLAADLDALGPDPGAALRAHRQQATQDADRARTAASEAATAQTLAEERARNLLAALEEAIAARDRALSEFPSGLAEGTADAEERLNASLVEQDTVQDELSSLEKTINTRSKQLAEAVRAATEEMEKARAATEAAQTAHTEAIDSHASEVGRLAELRKLRAAEDLAAAEQALRQAEERHAVLPVPERPVTPEEVQEARETLATVKQDLETLVREILHTQGRLEQVGGAVARDRLREATEAYELAERYEREVEEDYEAWKLLLEQMKEADAAQASNLGRALAPAIESRFQALAGQRYQSLHLTANLGTEGVVIAGEVRPPDRISVGTREQLSTLYRLCLGEYLQTAIVLDDQLVQSDQSRMDWFRTLLAEKSRTFQIVVFTCRPEDYLSAAEMAGEDGPIHADSDEGYVRAIDLGRAVRRG
jgi:hypothetical protein